MCAIHRIFIVRLGERGGFGWMGGLVGRRDTRLATKLTPPQLNISTHDGIALFHKVLLYHRWTLQIVKR